MNWIDLDEIEVLIFLIKIKFIIENFVFLKDKEFNFFFWYFVKFDRKGSLCVFEEYFLVF